MKNNWPQIVQMTQIFILVLFMVGIVGAVTFDELIDSYSFDYDSGDLELLGIDYGLSGDDLVFDLSFGEVASGKYFVYVDVKDEGGIVSGEWSGDLIGDENVSLGVKSYFLSGASEFNCSLRIYDSEGALVYWEDFDIVGLDYGGVSFDDSYDALEFVENGSVFFDIGIDSRVDVDLESCLFLGVGDEVFEVCEEVDFAVGENWLTFEFGDVYVENHYSGNLRILGLSIGELVMRGEYIGGYYSYEDFIEGNYLRDCYFSGVDEDDDGLFDYLDLTVEGFFEDVGDYDIDGMIFIKDEFGWDFNESFGILNSGYMNFSFYFDGESVYASEKDGELYAHVFLYNENGSVDYLDICGVTNFSYLDFERPGLADLVLVKENDLVCVLNDGENAAYGFDLQVLENGLNWSVEFLDIDEEVCFGVGDFDFGNWTFYVDYSGEVDEESEENNYFVLELFEDEVCVEDVVNSSWGDWVNVTSCVEEEFEQVRSRVEFDSNFCGGFVNVTHYESRFQGCAVEDEDDDRDYDSGNGKTVRHVFGYEYGDWGEWKDVSFCRENGTILQERSRVLGEFEDVEFREIGCEISLNGVGEGMSCDERFDVCFGECRGFGCLGCFARDFGCRVGGWF